MLKKVGALLIPVSFMVLAGCATPTAVNLTDGTKIDSVDTPEYDEDSGFYTVETIDGHERQVNKDMIRSMEAMD